MVVALLEFCVTKGFISTAFTHKEFNNRKEITDIGEKHN